MYLENTILINHEASILSGLENSDFSHVLGFVANDIERTGVNSLPDEIKREMIELLIINKLN
jgi:hypothetical protein